MIGLKTLTSLCHQLQKNNYSDLLAHIFLRFVSPALSFGIGYSQWLPCIEFGFVTLNRKMRNRNMITWSPPLPEHIQVCSINWQSRNSCICSDWSIINIRDNYARQLKGEAKYYTPCKALVQHCSWNEYCPPRWEMLKLKIIIKNTNETLEKEHKQIHWKTRKLNVWYGIHVQEG